MSRGTYQFDPSLDAVVVVSTYYLQFNNDEDSSIREEGDYIEGLHKGMIINTKDLYDLSRGRADAYIETYQTDAYRSGMDCSYTDENGYECLRCVTYAKVVRNT